VGGICSIPYFSFGLPKTMATLHGKPGKYSVVIYVLVIILLIASTIVVVLKPDNWNNHAKNLGWTALAALVVFWVSVPIAIWVNERSVFNKPMSDYRKKELYGE